MKKANRILTVLMFIFLYIPMAVLIVASFNTGKDIAHFEGFTLMRYVELFRGYILNPITYWLAKRIVKIRYISLGNLIVDRFAFKEFIQDDCNADALVAEIRELIENQERRQAMLDEYAAIRAELGGTGASAAVAKAMADCLK